MYSNVIVPLDGSELSEMALPYARLIAGGLAIPIELVEAFDILPPAVHHRHSAW
jgi:nucleotide-binding universal stress UspA family protein